MYYRFKDNSSRMPLFYCKALEESGAAGDTKLLVIPAMENIDRSIEEAEMILRNSENVINLPVVLEVLCIVSKAKEKFSDADAKRSASNTALNMAKEIQNQLLQSSIGLFHFQRNVNAILQNISSKRKDVAKMIMYLEQAIEKCSSSKENSSIHKSTSVTLVSHQEALANCYADHTKFQYNMQNYFFLKHLSGPDS